MYINIKMMSLSNLFHECRQLNSRCMSYLIPQPSASCTSPCHTEMLSLPGRSRSTVTVDLDQPPRLHSTSTTQGKQQKTLWCTSAQLTPCSLHILYNTDDLATPPSSLISAYLLFVLFGELGILYTIFMQHILHSLLQQDNSGQS